jgi:hypothetical protein
MIGLPTETEDDIMKTIHFLHKARPFYGGLGVYSPFPRTKLFDQGVSMGLLDPVPSLEHFLKTNPKDLFFKDPERRVLNIDHRRFQELTQLAMSEFHRHNSRISNLFRRGFARRKAYMYDPSLLKADLKRVTGFLGLNRFFKSGF